MDKEYKKEELQLLDIESEPIIEVESMQETDNRQIAKNL